MIASFLYCCVYGYLIFVPGWLITRLLDLRRGRFLLALALSYALLILNLIPMEWLRAPLWVFFLASNLQVIILLAANLIMEYRWRGRVRSRSEPRTPRQSGAATAQLVRSLLAHWWPPLLIVLGVFVYLAWAGPYMELPSDPWQHVGRFLQAQTSCIDSGHFEPINLRGGAAGELKQSLSRQGCHWYIVHALICKTSGLAIVDSVLPLTVANTIVFCLAIYWFAMFLWARQRIARCRKIQASLWAVGFTVLWLGVNIFAYVRYYALAPAILNYVVYLAAVVLMLDYFRSRSWWSHALWIVPLLVMVMNVIHTQEAAFAFFMGIGMLIVIEGQWVWGGWRRRKHRTSNIEHRTSNIEHPTPNVECRKIMEVSILPAGNMLKIHIFAVVGLGLFGLLFYYSLNKPMAGYSAFLLRPLFHGEWLGQKWFIQPPAEQFFQVLTCWGVFVYALFLIYAGSFRRQPFILAGMLMPLLIVFNPVTLLILSRWISDLNAIYRFNYMIPLPFVAGFLAMRFWKEMRSWRKPALKTGKTCACNQDSLGI